MLRGRENWLHDMSTTGSVVEPLPGMPWVQYLAPKTKASSMVMKQQYPGHNSRTKSPPNHNLSLPNTQSLCARCLPSLLLLFPLSSETLLKGPPPILFSPDYCQLYTPEALLPLVNRHEKAQNLQHTTPICALCATTQFLSFGQGAGG